MASYPPAGETTVLLIGGSSSYLAPISRLSQIGRSDDLNRGAVVENAARVEPSRGDKNVDLGPICFQTTGLDTIKARVPVKFTQFIAKCNRIPITQRKPRCGLRRHEDVVAPAPVNGSLLLSRMLLNCLPRRIARWNCPAGTRSSGSSNGLKCP